MENDNHKNCFQLTTDLTADDDSDSEKVSRAQVMLKFGKRGVGHGVIEGYQWDSDRLKTGSYLGSNNVDIIQAYEYNKLPRLKGKDYVLYWDSFVYQVISGDDPTYGSFLDGKTLKELKEIFYYDIIQFTIFERNHISEAAIYNLSSVVYKDFLNAPRKEVNIIVL